MCTVADDRNILLSPCLYAPIINVLQYFLNLIAPSPVQMSSAVRRSSFVRSLSEVLCTSFVQNYSEKHASHAVWPACPCFPICQSLSGKSLVQNYSEKYFGVRVKTFVQNYPEKICQPRRVARMSVFSRYCQSFFVHPITL
jgi:hypothetical protein